MEFSISNLKLGRFEEDRKTLVPPDSKRGAKWACASAVAVAALAILGAFLVTALALAVSHFVVGVGVFTGVCLLGSAIVDALPFTYITLVAVQCILNAQHHLRKVPPPVVNQYIPVKTF